MQKIIIGFLFGLCFFRSSFAQESYSISGVITDESSGETVIGASVSIKELANTGAYTNSYGFYSISIPEGDYTLIVRYYDYEDIIKPIQLNSDLTIDFNLSPKIQEVEEVIVSVKKNNENITSDQMGVETLDVKEISKIPVLFGEQDVVKTLTLTPGVKTSGEGSGGMFVRGGNSSQNLVLLDEATVFNSSHLLGFFSVFNSDALKNVTLYKGTAPAEYGGRTSSVLDVKMKEGNNQGFHVGGGLGLISSRLYIEGPIVKSKGSFLVSGRRTYADLFLKLSSDETLNNTALYFYDINVKANYKINEKNRIYLSGYFGRDVSDIQDRFGNDWGNTTGTFRWTHIWSPKLFSNTSLIYSDYKYKSSITNDDLEYSITSIIDNWNLKHKFNYFLNTKNKLTFGFGSQYSTITPGQVEFPDDSELSVSELQERTTLDNSLFISHNWKPSARWNITYGVRLSSFSLFGEGDFYSYKSNGDVSDTTHYNSGEFVQSYLNLEPRFNASFILNKSSSLKTSYTRNTQNLHLIQNSNASASSDLWIASSKNVKPEISDQASLGYFLNFKESKYQFSGEVYYRWMQNQIDLKNGADIRANEHIEGELLFGVGRSYGLELMLKKKYGKFNGWLSYSLSRTERQIEGINNGNWYAAKQDATHAISVVGIYDINKKWSVSGTWVYSTGSAVTFPSGKYEINNQVEFYYTERNGHRMPDYHRLDLGATRYFKKSKKFESSLNLSVYNAYGRKNAYSIDFEENPNDATKTQAVMTYLFTFVPSVTYNFKF